MTVGEIKDAVMFQTNNDVDDVSDFLPFLLGYINDGYDRLVYAWAGEHIGPGEHPVLERDSDTPALPEWLHSAVLDWATWLVYRNGNPQKQNRGYPFRASFDEALQRIAAEGGAHGKVQHFFNIP